MNKKFILLLVVLIISLFGCSSNSSSSNDDFPSKTIEITVPWSAGGSSDQTARALAEAMSDVTDQNVVVVNKEGAGGTIATSEMATQQPDAHKILFDAVGVFTTQPHMQDVQYSIDDFRPVKGLTYEPIVLLVNSDSPWETLDDLIADKGERITYAHSGAGGLPDLAQAAFLDQAGIEAESVAYEGQNPAVSALLGGHVDTVAAHPGAIMQHVDSGDLRILGVFSPERYEDLPDVPTFKEKGFPIDMSVWKFLLVSKETSDKELNKLTEIVEKAMESQKYKDFLKTANLTPEEISGEEISERLEKQYKEHGDVIDKMGLSKK
ncbi:ABC transporter substrate-binding protein [Lentibacillus populi]|uniref:ABC transporter substrate-binding protein n=1 Tax=Lentibacillus populi TaxID=1827502 RepID=A0A9W5X418_9BACI|nr:tripartite tricarboxylate transporter substrate binding protein [Lentibacillus populi]GGB31903.1 ABC transporter substrate-binding protein [Lentibacillus populi]